MLLNYQNQRRLAAELAPQPPRNFATVTAVATDGLTLQFDGETAAAQKKYKYNTAITFTVGQRVKVAKISGTYIVEYPI